MAGISANGLAEGLTCDHAHILRQIASHYSIVGTHTSPGSTDAEFLCSIWDMLAKEAPATLSVSKSSLYSHCHSIILGDATNKPDMRCFFPWPQMTSAEFLQDGRAEDKMRFVNSILQSLQQRHAVECSRSEASQLADPTPMCTVPEQADPLSEDHCEDPHVIVKKGAVPISLSHSLIYRKASASPYCTHRSCWVRALFQSRARRKTASC